MHMDKYDTAIESLKSRINLKYKHQERKSFTKLDVEKSELRWAWRGDKHDDTFCLFQFASPDGHFSLRPDGKKVSCPLEIKTISNAVGWTDEVTYCVKESDCPELSYWSSSPNQYSKQVLSEWRPKLTIDSLFILADVQREIDKLLGRND